MTTFTLPDLHTDGRAFIDGQRCDAASGASYTKASPINGQQIAQISRCDGRDIDRAVAAARKAWTRGVWANKPPAERKQVLGSFARLVVEHGDELAMLESIDMGKPLSFAQQVDVQATARCIAWYGEAIDKIYDQIAPTPRNSLALITREPVGVVGAIVPWNYPMIMAAWKIAPALAMGNCVVLKPSEKSPLTAMRLGELALQAGLPPGVLNVVPGFGAEAGEPLALHMDVDCIAFTGSTAVGKQIHIQAGQSNLKRAWTELGGKSPHLVFADCPHLDKAAQAAIDSLCFNQGESCNAPSRLLLERSIQDDIVGRLEGLTKSWQPANPLEPDTHMGALVDQSQLARVMEFVASGIAEGARLVCGGTPVLTASGGFYMPPTLFDQVDQSMRIAREEIFGPVLSILTFDSEEQAITMANDTIYGLQAGLWTSDLNRAVHVSRALRVGTVHVNQYDGDDITVPFGGFKQSGTGRDKSLHALDKYTELKTTWIEVGG